MINWIPSKGKPNVMEGLRHFFFLALTFKFFHSQDLIIPSSSSINIFQNFTSFKK